MWKTSFDYRLRGWFLFQINRNVSYFILEYLRWRKSSESSQICIHCLPNLSCILLSIIEYVFLHLSSKIISIQWVKISPTVIGDKYRGLECYLRFVHTTCYHLVTWFFYAVLFHLLRTSMPKLWWIVNLSFA